MPGSLVTISQVRQSGMTSKTLRVSDFGMLSQFLTPAYVPFTFSFLLMVGIGLIEAIGLGFGHLDLDGDLHVGGHVSVLDWLGLGGELPVLIWLTSLLGCFTLFGLGVQQGAIAILGNPLPWGIACVGALAAAVPCNTLAANLLARIVPKFETTVISTDELLRRRGTILEGTARRGSPARAKVIDRHGQAHYIMVEPHDEGESIQSGETALLVRREGQLFFAISGKSPFLQPI